MSCKTNLQESNNEILLDVGTGSKNCHLALRRWQQCVLMLTKHRHDYLLTRGRPELPTPVLEKEGSENCKRIVDMQTLIKSNALLLVCPPISRQPAARK